MHATAGLPTRAEARAADSPTEWIRRLAPAGGSWTRERLAAEHASDPVSIDAAVDEIGAGAVAWVVETAQRITARLRTEGETLGVPAVSTGFGRLACEGGMLNALLVLSRDRLDDAAATSPGLMQVARVAVRQGIPLDVLVHRAWASHTAAQDELLAIMARLVPPDRQVEAIRRMSGSMFAFGNANMRRLADAFEQERRAWNGRLPEEQHRVIQSIVHGRRPPAHAEQLLGVRFDGGHLSALAWSGDAGYPVDRDADLARFAVDAARALGATVPLVLERDGAVHLWFTFPGEPPADAAAVVQSLARPDWLRLALGPAGTGIEGFRAGYHGAQQAAHVGRLASEGEQWSYHDVSHLALLLADRDAAARFVRRELGALLGPGERLDELRSTLRLYLEHGNSRVAVAESLHLAPTTVAYRVGQAGELLGHGVQARRMQVLLALQLVHLVPELGAA